MENNKKTPQKPEVFIGKIFNNGLLEVVGICDEKGTRGRTLYKAFCKVCSPDLELFPLGYFVCTKGHLEEGKLPCGCSRYNWEDWQFLIKAKRAGEKRGFKVHGFSEEYNGKTTRLDCECLVDGHRWTPRCDSIVNTQIGCPYCKYTLQREQLKTPENIALERCVQICINEGYKPLGFVDGYLNAHKARFEYECPVHGKQSSRYIDFVYIGSRCPSCTKGGYNPSKPGSFYITKWTKDDHSFLKFGITNVGVTKRIKQQFDCTEYEYEILYSQVWEDGNIALSLERFIKKSKTFNLGVISSDKFNDCFTETINIEDLPMLNKMVESFLTYL